MVGYYAGKWRSIWRKEDAVEKKGRTGMGGKLKTIGDQELGVWDDLTACLLGLVPALYELHISMALILLIGHIPPH